MSRKGTVRVRQLGATVAITALGALIVSSAMAGGTTSSIRDAVSSEIRHSTSSNTFWSSGTPSVATISQSGLVTGVGPGQSVITAASETVSGSATMTVIVGGLTSIQVTSQDGFTNITYGSSEQFVATGTANGEHIDITDSVTWSTNPRSIPNVSIDSSRGLLTTTSGGTAIVQFEVIATDPTTGISDGINFTVRP